MAKLFKVRDTVTQKFWNGNYRRSEFGTTGKTWKKRDAVESTVGHFIRYRARFNSNATHSLPDSWEIVEVELVEKELASENMNDFLKFVALKTEVTKVNSSYGQFLDKMRAKGVLDKIEFLILLKPAEGNYWINRERIVEARAHLRQLGVKTRTFREGGGVFGMMDRQQALRARLTLDVESVVDLAALRAKLNI